MGGKYSLHADAEIVEDFFELPLDFGIICQGSFEAAICIFLQVFSFKVVIFERIFYYALYLDVYGYGFV